MPFRDETGDLKNPVDPDDQENLDRGQKLLFKFAPVRINSLIPRSGHRQREEVDGRQ